MKIGSLFFCALAAAGCAEHGVVLQQPVGSTTATVSAAPASGGPAAAPAAPVDAEHVAPPSESSDPCTDPPTMTFSGSSTAITEGQTEELRRLAECLNAPPNEDTTVVLVGYTDLMGTVPANLELGLSRAQGLMKHLIRSGVAPGRIVVASAGELQRPSARMGLHAPRVEIMIARGGPSRPNEAPIARGIDAEGLIRRPRKEAVSTTAAPTSNRPTNTRPARSR